MRKSTQLERELFKQRNNGKEWVASSSVTNCTSCNEAFTIWLRKHHCRFCGHIFCFRCSSMVIDNQRCCAFCFVQTKSIQSSPSLSPQDMFSSPKGILQRSDTMDSIASDRSTMTTFNYNNTTINSIDNGKQQPGTSMWSPNSRNFDANNPYNFLITNSDMSPRINVPSSEETKQENP